MAGARRHRPSSPRRSPPIRGGRRREPGRPRAGPGARADEAAGAARPRRLDRLRAGRRLVLLLADGDGRRGHAHARRRGRWRSTGDAWFDHQWGDFISVGGGGWDWFAVNLDDGTDLTLSLVRDADGSLSARLRHARRRRRHDPPPRPRRLHRRGHRPLDEPDDRRRLPGRLDDRRSPPSDLRDRPRPTVADQELDTRATTGVVYWEGSQVVSATRAGDAARRRGATWS